MTREMNRCERPSPTRSMSGEPSRGSPAGLGCPGRRPRRGGGYREHMARAPSETTGAPGDGKGPRAFQRSPLPGSCPYRRAQKGYFPTGAWPTPVAWPPTHALCSRGMPTPNRVDQHDVDISTTHRGPERWARMVSRTGALGRITRGTAARLMVGDQRGIAHTMPRDLPVTGNPWDRPSRCANFLRTDLGESVSARRSAPRIGTPNREADGEGILNRDE